MITAAQPPTADRERAAIAQSPLMQHLRKMVPAEKHAELLDEIENLSRIGGEEKDRAEHEKARRIELERELNAVRKSAGAEGAEVDTQELADCAELITKQWKGDVELLDGELARIFSALKTAAKSTPGVDVASAESRGYYRAKDEARNRYFEDGLQSFMKWLGEPRKPDAKGGTP